MRVAQIFAVLGLGPRLVGAQTLDLPPLEPFGKHLRVTIQLEGEPDWLAPYGNRAWALTVTGMALVDPEEPGRVLRVPVRKPCGAPVSAYGALWVASCADSAILRIDPSRGAVVANVSAPLVEYESSMAATDSSIRFISDSVSTLTRLDVGTNRVVARIRVRPGSTGVATGFWGRLGEQHRDILIRPARVDTTGGSELQSCPRHHRGREETSLSCGRRGRSVGT